MDAEIILRSCWRHRLRLGACALVGGLLFAIGGHMMLSKAYVSSADVSVAGAFPSSLVDTSANQVYAREPDRFVATQIEVLSSRGAAAKVADDLGIPTQVVVDALDVRQLAKSDVIRLSATTPDPKLSARIAEGSASNYLDTVQAQTASQYDAAITSLNEQKDVVDKAIAALPRTSASSAEGGNEYRSLVAQQGRLAINLQQLVLASKVAPDSTRLVSRAAANPVPMGKGTTTLFVYGAALGLALALCWVAIAARPGQSLEVMEEVDTVAGVPVLGMLRRTKPRFGRKRKELAEIGTLGVAGELARLVQLKGPLSVLVMAPARATWQLAGTLAPAVQVMLARHPEGWSPDADHRRPVGAGSDGPVMVRSLTEHLKRSGSNQLVVLAVEADVVRPSELDTVMAGLRTSGSDVVGIIGIR
ncbi:hypothetical protein [Aquihabitans sp. McL0605]|uniref:hypothetical protein n=1 Tax=Aquihabitans sp. McL0605 TaxID=3415671 RepID=UPI003CF4CC4C